MRQFLGNHPGKIIHMIGIAIGSFWITGNVLNSLWQNPTNNNSIKTLKDETSQAINIKTTKSTKINC